MLAFDSFLVVSLFGKVVDFVANGKKLPARENIGQSCEIRLCMVSVERSCVFYCPRVLVKWDLNTEMIVWIRYLRDELVDVMKIRLNGSEFGKWSGLKFIEYFYSVLAQLTVVNVHFCQMKNNIQHHFQCNCPVRLCDYESYKCQLF